MDAKDTWQVNAGAGSDAAATIGIEACGDMSGFNDDMVTFSFVAKSLAGVPTGYGNVAAGADLVVTVRSEGEDKPTVSFATTSIASTRATPTRSRSLPTASSAPRSDR